MFDDLDSCSIGGSWKSATSTCTLYQHGLKKRKQYDVHAITLDQALSSSHNFIKLDIEGSEMAVLTQEREFAAWQNARVLVFEYSVNRSRKYGLNWCAGVLRINK